MALQQFSPLLPSSIEELLPKSNEDVTVSFVAVGPILIDALNSGLDFNEACKLAHITGEQGCKLLANPQFIKYVEAYLTIGDITDRSVRLRIAKSILAAQIATGHIIGKRRDALDILNLVNKEMDVKRGTGVQVNVFQNNTVARPYMKDVNGVKVVQQEPSKEQVQEQFDRVAEQIGYTGDDNNGSRQEEG